MNKAKEKLNQPATITELLQTVKNQIDSINDNYPVGEDQLSYYESFVNEVTLIIQDNSDGSHAPFFGKVEVSNNKDTSNIKETAKEDIENQIKSITNSISNLRTSLQAKKKEQENKKIEQEDTLIQKNTSIESIFKTMDSTELQNFKNMIEQLQTGKIDVKHLDPLSDISKLLVAVTNSLDR